MRDRYPGKNEQRWPFVLIAIAFWILALFMVHIRVWLVAMVFFSFGVSMIWPNLFYGKEATDRFKRWLEFLRIWP